MSAGRFQIVALTAAPLAVPLLHPFVIATGRVDVTPNVLVTVQVRDAVTGMLATGLGEAATLPPVTRETQPAVLTALAHAGQRLPQFAHDVAGVDGALPWALRELLGPCAAAGLDMAVADALGQLLGLPVAALLDPTATTRTVESDITIGIAAPDQMALHAAQWAKKGFDCFKVKVGRDLVADLAALTSIARAVPGCRLRIDANAGYTEGQALELVDALSRLPLTIECFEQPCATDDLAGLAAVTCAAPFDVIADESAKTLPDVDRMAGVVDGINLKLVKCGSLGHALAMGRRAQQLGLTLMVGAMVETRLGIAAAAHLACALGGVAYPDVDTAWLLADDPFVGGPLADGPRLTVPASAGLGLVLRQ